MSAIVEPLSNAEADVLAFAARYALARPNTTASLTVVGEIERLWPRLRYWQGRQMQNEIEATAERPRIWDRVLKLSLEDLLQ